MTTSLWTPALKERVKSLWSNHSSREICAILSAETGLEFRRNQVIGIAHRMGLSVTDKVKIHPHTSRKAEGRPLKPRVRKPKFKVVMGGGNSMRIIESSETTAPALRCVEIEPLNLTLAELRHDECHWIEQEPAGACYCGHPVSFDAKYPYCSRHMAIRSAPWKRHMEAAE